MNINVVSLFDGHSTGRLVLKRAGIEVYKYFASEIDENAMKISKKNFDDIIRLGNVTLLDETELKKLPRIDLLIGGSPCQNNSRAGDNKGLEGTESKLFFEYLRVLNWIRDNNNPNVQFLLENVEMKKATRDTISNYMNCEPIAINSKLLSAQNRPRLYWTSTYIEPPEDKQIKLLDILENVDTSNYIDYKGLKIDPSISEKAYNLIDVVDGEVRISQATKQGYIVANNGDGVNLQFPTSKTRRGRVIKEKSNTLDCSCDICVYYDGIIRKFTIVELERLQTLPDGYTKADGLSDKARIKAIGNGWTGDIIVDILKQYKFDWYIIN